MEGKREEEEAEAPGRPEMQEAAGRGGGEALCLSCSLGPRVHNVHHFRGSVSEALLLDLSNSGAWASTPQTLTAAGGLGAAWRWRGGD